MSLTDSARFLSAFLRSPTRVGAIAPSSPALARAMVKGIRINGGEAIIEFGPGTGPFTDEIRRTLTDPGCYLGIERDQAFVTLLQNRFPGFRFVCASAEDAPRSHREAGLGKVRAIICGLPFASLPPGVQDGVIAAIDGLLTPGCEFRTFQYVHAYLLPGGPRFRRRMDAIFGPHTRSAPVMLNLPPSFVLTWRR